MIDDLLRKKTKLQNWRLPQLEFDTKDQILLGILLISYHKYIFFNIVNSVPQYDKQCSNTVGIAPVDYNRMTIPSKNLRHTGEASLTVFTIVNLCFIESF